MHHSRAGCRFYILLIAVHAIGICVAGCVRQRVTNPLPPTPKREQSSFVDAITNIKNSIAPVVCVQTHPTGDWELRSIEGTAFFVAADGSFITPNHVLEGLTNPNRRTPCPMAAVYIPEDRVWHTDRANFRIHYALFLSQTCRHDAHLDIAFCTPLPGGMTLPGGTTIVTTPVVFENNLPSDGSPVAFSGFPLSNVAPISAVGFVAGYQGTDDLGTFTIIVDRSTWPGASGSPIYLPNGRVIGMVLARGTGEGIGLTYGRVGHFVYDFLPEAYRIVE
jgi:hypothetical protein